MIGTTINNRIEEAIKTVEQIPRMPFPTKVKATFIRMAAFPEGLCGIEAAPRTMAKR